MENIFLRNARFNDFEKIVKVHMECFAENFSTKMGMNLLKNYYLEYYNKFPELFIVAENSATNEIIGFVNGFINNVIGSEIKNSFVKNNFWKLAARLIKLLITFDKLTWKKVPKHIKLFMKKIKRNKNTSKLSSEVKTDSKTIEGDLLSICVIESYRGLGISCKLIDEFEKKLKKQGIQKYTLSVLNGNERAKAFYEKCGFEVQYIIPTGTGYVKNLNID